MQISISNSIKGFRGGKNNVQKVVDAFKSRVLADGGTFEAEGCLKKTLIELGGFSNEGLIVFNFQQRVFIEGGVCEAQTCLIDTLTNLNNI
jgi:hypothetical protein